VLRPELESGEMSVPHMLQKVFVPIATMEEAQADLDEFFQGFKIDILKAMKQDSKQLPLLPRA